MTESTKSGIVRMKKKIVIISPAYPYRGGQSLVEAHLFDTLTQEGFECNTISFKLLYPKIFFPGRTQYDISNRSFFKHTKHVKRLINSIDPFSWNSTIKYIQGLDPDLVLFVWWTPFLGPAYSWIANGIKRRSKSKVGFIVENYISHENRWFDQYWSRKTLARADFFISHSKYIGESLKRYHPKITLFTSTLPVYDIFNLDQWSKTSAREKLGLSDGKVILFFGLIRPYKGLDRLIQSIKSVQEVYPDIQLLIAGEFYDNRQKYFDLIEQLNLNDRITVHGEFISNEDVEIFFKASDVVCLPYKSATQSGIQMIAYGFGKPVVVTNEGGLSELVQEGKTGSITQENTTRSISDSIIKILNGGDQENYSENIKAYIKQLGYKNMHEIMDQMIDQR